MPGKLIYDRCNDLFPLCRSLSGEGINQTLAYIKRILPELQIHEIASGDKVFDWEVPNEWNIKDAWVKNAKGEKIIDFKKTNLHIVGYSEPVHKKIPLAELQEHLYSLPEKPDAIPYITSYYKRRWGFCLTHDQRQELQDGEYEVFIDSSLRPGIIKYADVIIPGESEKEILFSCYICHPSMANNELSGPMVIAALAEWLKLEKRHYTYRMFFGPETIGSIAYLSKNLAELQKNLIAGFAVSCIGDERDYSFVNTPYGNTLADRVIELAAKEQSSGKYSKYPYLERGSDERQYCSPGVRLPVVSVCRSKYDIYPEYHTSKDDMSLITPKGLQGGFEYLQKAIIILENSKIYNSKYKCEPQLGKRGLYPTIATKDTFGLTSMMMNLLVYCDGTNDLATIAKLTKAPLSKLEEIAGQLLKSGIIERV
jgi:aminopeptidase-like protein